jgi:glycosyltransferase involved in cell wall biosynthesis
MRSAPARRLRPSTVTVVIPALNEEPNIAWVLERMPQWVSEVVLVDGLSTDHTEVVARQLVPNLVVVHQAQRGKGAALRAGFAAATGDIIVMIDADGSTDPEEMDRFVQALLDGAEFVKGSRHLPEGGSEDWTYLRRAGNRSFVRLVNALYGSDFTDLCYGYCGFWRRSLGVLALTADGFEIETELTLRAVKAGLKIREVASVELPRRAGRSNLNAFRDGRRVLRTILSHRASRDRRGAATRHQIDLESVERPWPGSRAWRPAGRDRRNAERRLLDLDDVRYAGPERRRFERRQPPGRTHTVHRAVERLAAA